MSAWLIPSSKAVIICGYSARLNLGIVIISGLDFVGCFENHIVSVGQFQLENSAFFGNGQATISGTVLTIEESTVSLDRVPFISTVKKLQTSVASQVPDDCYAGTVETMDAVIGILLRSSNIRITQSQFEGNNIGLGAVIYDEFDSDITVFNTIFVNSSAAQYCNSYCCFTGGIVYTSKQHKNTLRLYHSEFEQNVGVVTLGHAKDNILYTKVLFTSTWLLFQL